MILSDHTRRWLEVRFYYFCFDIFHNRGDMLDVIYAIEAVGQLGSIDLKQLKLLSGKILGDPYYMPTQNELVLLAHLNEVKTAKIAAYINKTKNHIYKIIQQKLPKYAPYPLLSVKEDETIKDFFDLLDVIRKAGI